MERVKMAAAFVLYEKTKILGAVGGHCCRQRVIFNLR
jgi:hypothetical protein